MSMSIFKPLSVSMCVCGCVHAHVFMCMIVCINAGMPDGPSDQFGNGMNKTNDAGTDPVQD
jgi:hypothetical protein